MLSVAIAMFAATAGAAAPRLKAIVEPGIDAVVTSELQIELAVSPRRSEAFSTLARRITGDGANWKVLAELNDLGSNLLLDRRVRVPLSLVRPKLQRATMDSLFTHDHASEAGWLHRVTTGNTVEGEPLWKIAEWFTGDGANYSAIRAANGRQQLSTRPGEVILVPASLLSEAYRWSGPAKNARLPEPSIAEDDPPVAPVDTVSALDMPSTSPTIELAATRTIEPASLRYVRTGERPFATYRLKKGEALYSSVVIRFTGRLFAKDVNEVVDQLVAFNGIADVSKLPVGYDVRIPVDLLLPEYRPLDDPRRVEMEQVRRESAKLTRRVEARNLEGVHVILDAGHGGRDVGTEHKGIWESSYVYDVTCRLKKRLEETSGAKVYLTTKSTSNGCKIQSRDKLKNYTDHQVLTTPAYPLEDSIVGVNLRWYLANSIFRKASKKGEPEKVLFLSIHADSLHPSIRGAMAYVPGARFTKGTFQKSGAIYLARAEVKENPVVMHSKEDALHAEGLSTELAEAIIGEFGEAGLGVHPFNPVRDNVVRGGREWVPAVIRYNSVPTRVLLEICNLGNAEDRTQIQTRKNRDAIASAIHDGIVAYFGAKGSDDSRSVMTVAGR
ncbi:MAG: N-acetylmuramoyl-L-alanine amidase [Acidobacteria bacterium]|nr:N-acetylmuramoyl-L-alanine amidase [Acidobacteriota bacterium]